MIVIPRKKGESVVINEDIILTVIEIKGDKVRLGVEHQRVAASQRVDKTRPGTGAYARHATEG